MKRILLYSMLLITFLAAFAGPALATNDKTVVINTKDGGWQIDTTGKKVDLTSYYGACKNVKSSSSSLFMPTRTSPEWVYFDSFARRQASSFTLYNDCINPEWTNPSCGACNSGNQSCTHSCLNITCTGVDGNTYNQNQTETFNQGCAVCGNSAVEAGETCDAGAQNGVVCTAEYGQTCTYCNSSCQTVSVVGPKCGDGAINGEEAAMGCDTSAGSAHCTNCSCDYAYTPSGTGTCNPDPCLINGGTWVSVDNGTTNICKFPGAACPSGWTYYGYSTTKATTYNDLSDTNCVATGGDPCGAVGFLQCDATNPQSMVSCTTGSHAFSTAPDETCTNTIYSCAPGGAGSMCGNGDPRMTCKMFGLTRTHYAQTTEVGCYNWKCGDGTCNPQTETCSSCPGDCGACPVPPPGCGNGICGEPITYDTTYVGVTNHFVDDPGRVSTWVGNGSMSGATVTSCTITKYADSHKPYGSDSPPKSPYPYPFYYTTETSGPYCRVRVLQCLSSNDCCSDSHCDGFYLAITYHVNGTENWSNCPADCGDWKKEPPCGCFVAGTKVLLADGRQVPIETVKEGDLVKGASGVNKVLKRLVFNDKGWKLYSFNGGPYFVTEGHPFMTPDGWKSMNPKVSAKENPGLKVTQLKVGDQLVTRNGLVRLDRIDGKDTDVKKVYNFRLDGNKDYYADDYLVHNKLAVCP